MMFAPVGLLIKLIIGGAGLALVVGMLILVWRLVTRGSLAPPSEPARTPGEVRPLTVWGLMLASVVGALVLITVFIPIVVAPEAFPVAMASTLAFAGVVLGSASLIAHHSAQRSGSVRSASLATEGSVLPGQRSIWPRTWIWPTLIALVSIGITILGPHLARRSRALSDGTVVSLAPIPLPALNDLALVTVVNLAVATATTVAIAFIIRQPRPQRGWDPRRTLVAWCSGVSIVLNASWLAWIPFTIGRGSPSSQRLDSTSASGIQVSLPDGSQTWTVAIVIAIVALMIMTIVPWPLSAPAGNLGEDEINGLHHR